jgi:hypothetical protein
MVAELTLDLTNVSEAVRTRARVAEPAQSSSASSSSLRQTEQPR